MIKLLMGIEANIRLSENQEEGYQKNRISGFITNILIPWYSLPDNLILWFPDYILAEAQYSAAVVNGKDDF